MCSLASLSLLFTNFALSCVYRWDRWITSINRKSPQSNHWKKEMTTRSFFEAFKDRYLDASDDVDLEVLTIKATQKYTKELVVELVGREQAIDTFKNLKNLRQIVLVDCSIASLDQRGDQSSSGEPIANEELKANLKSNRSIQSLDISHNQIDSWTEIVRIVQLFPCLEELIVSGNPFRSIESDDLDWQIRVLSNVKNLVAGRLAIDWPSIELFNKLFINLRSLNIFGNNLTDLELADSFSFANLEYLSLSENPVGWSNVLKLKQLRNLKHLQLNNCSLEEIVLDDESNLFGSIRQLNLNGNQIGKWSDIAELSKLGQLTDLSIRENPLFSGKDYDQIFNFIVAILKGLKVLNKQMVRLELSFKTKRPCENA